MKILAWHCTLWKAFKALCTSITIFPGNVCWFTHTLTPFCWTKKMWSPRITSALHFFYDLKYENFIIWRLRSSHGALLLDIISHLEKLSTTSEIDFKSCLVQLDYRWGSSHILEHIGYTFYQNILVGNGIYPFLNMYRASVLVNIHKIYIFSIFYNSLKDTIDRQNQLYHFDNLHKVLIS